MTPDHRPTLLLRRLLRAGRNACLAASLLPLACLAGWVKLGEAAGTTLYLERNTMQQTDANVHRAWEIQDLKAPDADGVRSRRYLNEYDCKNRMYRISNVTSFEGPMLTGRKLFDVDEAGYWRKVPGNGLFALGFVVHCAK